MRSIRVRWAILAACLYISCLPDSCWLHAPNSNAIGTASLLPAFQSRDVVAVKDLTLRRKRCDILCPLR